MKNEAYVNYLNSMNNASANNVNALAESQVVSEFYDKIQVDRQIVNYIVNKIKNNEHKVFIITGHAGDGKTSILVQVLKRLHVLSDNEYLKESDIKRSIYGDIYYVKDMSELDKDKQVEYLEKALNSVQNKCTSILISNTGPLLETFTRIFEENKYDVERKLLSQLDRNEDKEIKINDKTFYLINMARIDNVFFVKEILKKILDEQLWENCNCPIKENCPIYFNAMLLKKNFDKISTIIESIYRYFYEYDKRMTIRQILSHLTYSITGNLTCKEINEKHEKGEANNILIKYNFANLFFGYVEEKYYDDADQIKVIKELKKTKIEDFSLKEEYDLFVKGDFGLFMPEISKLLEKYWEKKYLKYYSVINTGDNKTLEKKLQNIRMMIKRFYLFYSYVLEPEKIIKNIFGNMFCDYSQIISNSMTKQDKKRLKNFIIDGLNKINIGMHKSSAVSDRLYITLRRDELTFQKVLILLAEINVEKLDVTQKLQDTNFEDFKNKYKLVLKYDDIELYELSLPLLMYFEEILSGRLETKVNPSLTHGILNLQTKLLEKAKIKQNGSIKILINNFDSIEKVTFEIEDNKLYVN